MKLSVIIPVYNVENYLKRCLDSVINQTYKAIKSTNRLPQIAIGNHHIRRLLCFSFALTSPLMATNVRPSISTISNFDIAMKCKLNYQIMVPSHS